MSLARRMKRKDTVPASVKRKAFEKGYMQGVVKQAPETKAQTIGDTLLAMLCFLRIKRGYGYK